MNVRIRHRYCKRHSARNRESSDIGEQAEARRKWSVNFVHDEMRMEATMPGFMGRCVAVGLDFHPQVEGPELIVVGDHRVPCLDGVLERA